MCWFSTATGCTINQSQNASKVTIGTFNIAWLGDGIDDKISRTEEDYLHIANVIKETNADVLGLQEIKNMDALYQVMKHLPEYKYYVGTHGRAQNVGILYKVDIEAVIEQEFMPIAVDTSRNRPGLVVSCRKGNFDWKMMIVHLKSSSHYDSTAELQSIARNTRLVQSEICSHWVDSTLKNSKEQDIFIVGDFNDYPQRKVNPTLTPLLINTSIEFLTFESKSCKNEKWFGIDHIVCSQSAKKRFIVGSEHSVNFYAQLNQFEADKISDHCPMVADFDISAPDND